MKILFSFAMLLVAIFCLVQRERAGAAEPAPVRKHAVKGETAKQPPADNKTGDVQEKTQKEPVDNAMAKGAQPLDLEAIIQPLRALFGGAPAAAPVGIAMPAENAADVEAQLNALNEQYLQQLMPTRAAELAFVRLLCSDLTVEQRRQIKAQADAGLKQAARQMADQQNQQQRGNVIQMNSTNAEPHKLIRDMIAKGLKETLTEEQWVRYSVEADARSAIRKRTAIQSVVSRLDDQLLLTGDQREKITQSLASKWQVQWEKWTLMSQVYGDRYFPVVPDQYITPLLTTEQKSVWQGIQKVDIGWWNGNQTQENNEDDWWNQPSNKNEPPAEGQPGNLRFRATEIFR